MLVCPVCNREYKKIDVQHLKKHGFETKDSYFEKYGESAPFGYSSELIQKKSGDNHPLKGKKRSEETRKKVSEGLKKNTKPRTEKQKEASRQNAIKMGATNIGRTHERTPEYKKKLSESLKKYLRENPRSQYAGTERHEKQLSHLKKIAEKRRAERLEKFFSVMSEWSTVDLGNLENALENNSRLDCVCNTCNSEVSWSLANFVSHRFSNTACQVCFPRMSGQSNGEEDLAKFVETLARVTRHFKLPSKLELDIYCEDEKIAIEYHGLYWHSSAIGYDKNKHVRKREECEKLGITLIQIFEDEWLANREKVEALLCAKFGKSRSMLMARKTTVEKMAFSKVKPFLEKHHLQGSGTPTSLNFALVSNGEIVAVATIGKSRAIFGGKSDSYELVRYSSLGVNGGFAKLLKAIRAEVSGAIVSYADLRYVSLAANVYIRNGFELVSTTLGYQYTDFVTRFNRWGFRKPEDTELTESEYWKKQGYYQIFDAGQAKYVLK